MTPSPSGQGAPEGGGRVAVRRLVPAATLAALAALGIPLSFFAANSHGLTVDAMTRPLAWSLVAGAALGATSALLFRRRGMAEFAGIVVIRALGAAALPGAALALVVTLLLDRRAPWPPSADGSARRLAIFLVALGLVIPGLVAATPPVVRQRTVAAPTRAVPGPDTWLIIADSHGRADVLASRFGYDDRAFLEGLRELGFAVSPDSRSNHLLTDPTLSVMLNGEPLASLFARHPGWVNPDGRPAFARAITGARLWDELARRGIPSVAIGPGVESVSARGSDRFIDPGPLSDVEVNLADAVGLSWLATAIDPYALTRIGAARARATFAAARSIADEPHDGERFVLVHLPVPHAPLVLRADGSLAGAVIAGEYHEEPARREAIGEAAWRAAVGAQTRWTDDEILALVRHILERDPAARIAVMGDHSSEPDARAGYARQLSPDELARLRSANLMAVRSPDRPVEVRGLTPVNLLGPLLGLDWPRADDRTWRCGNTLASCRAVALP